MYSRILVYISSGAAEELAASIHPNMMKRLDWAGERSDAAISRGFRVLEAGGRYLEPLTPPPPPRAPEPYKVVPPSSSLGRAHRRSSFVIIAETRPATPRSTSPSPNSLLGTGRVSPFRGRGFKGPLPHAQSRPQSPENRRHERFDPRGVNKKNSHKIILKIVIIIKY